jgi:predicted enzyme related to lactoylglutathione lyase
MITRVKFVGIPVRDQDRALAFYRDRLGFKVHTDQPMGEKPKQRWIELRIPGAETGVVLFTPEGHEGRVGTFFNGSFACDDVRKAFEALKARGVEFVGEPKEEPWGTYVMFKDSEGNSFVLGSK